MGHPNRLMSYESCNDVSTQQKLVAAAASFVVSSPRVLCAVVFSSAQGLGDPLSQGGRLARAERPGIHWDWGPLMLSEIRKHMGTAHFDDLEFCDVHGFLQLDMFSAIDFQVFVFHMFKDLKSSDWSCPNHLNKLLPASASASNDVKSRNPPRIRYPNDEL